jgi:hypothetical protein
MWISHKNAVALSLWFLPQFVFASDLVNCKVSVSGKLGSQNAYDVQRRLIVENAKVTEVGDKAAKVETAFGSKTPILHSFEKEGLLYQEIAPWFPDLKPLTKARMASTSSSGASSWMK